MKQIASRLWVGSDADFEQLNAFDTEWAIVHAAKDKWHRQFVGYKTAGAPEGPERLWARKGKRLALNLIDGPDPKYVSKSMIDEALKFITEQMTQIVEPDQCLIHCNKGHSRAPTLGLLYLAPTLPEQFEAAEAEYRTLYPSYQPGNGMREFARIHWSAYRNRKAPAATGNSAETDPNLDKAQELWRAFATDFASDPNMARDRLLDGIRLALQASGDKAALPLETICRPTSGQS